ncbi:MAG: hypothetical protein QW272_05210 [Candidatus Methanomethylicaceae archaeon]
MLNEIDELVKKYGKNGMRLLVLFRLLKSRVNLILQKQRSNLTFNEAVLNQLCISKAYELLKLGKDEPTEKDIEELLLRLRTR